MQLTGGVLRGIKIFSPKCLRPTSQRVRKSVFSILQKKIEGAVVLDLFCGSGILGIECLSRGAEIVVFVDSSREAMECVRENLMRCGMLHKGVLLLKPFPQCLKYLQGKFFFDLIFADPPYGGKYLEDIIKLCGEKVMKKGGILLLEHSKRDIFSYPEAGFELESKRRYGDTEISILRKL